MIEKDVVCELRERGLLLTTAESCTGGLVAARIVNVPGASGVFHEGYITYSDAAKSKLLGVKQETLNRYCAVSRETAYEMAEGGALRAEADVCVAVTGVAGPDMEDQKPVGLVYIGCCFRGKVTVLEYHFSGDRGQIRAQAAQAALEQLLDTIRS